MEKSYDRIKTGRLSLIIMIVMTVVNAIAWLFGSLYIFPYAAYTPQLTSLFARMLFIKYGFNGAVVFWILIGLALTSLYLYAWNLAKTKLKGFKIALVLFAIDTIFLVYSVSTTLGRWDVIFAIAMHGLILYHLIRAYGEFKQHPEAVERVKVKRK
jgi:hypothetical protein